MRLWLRYLKEKRLILLLYALTVFFFVAVGSLYHIENLEKLLYAALLTSTVWGLALLGEGFPSRPSVVWYVRRYVAR